MTHIVTFSLAIEIFTCSEVDIKHALFKLNCKELDKSLNIINVIFEGYYVIFEGNSVKLLKIHGRMYVAPDKKNSSILSMFFRKLFVGNLSWETSQSKNF